MLRIKELEKQYPDFHLNCSLEVPAGQVTGFIGPNGAGKSTTFRVALGLVRPDGGQIELFGKPMEQCTAKDKELLGVSLSDSGFSSYLSIRDIIPVLQHLYPSFDRDWFIQQCEHFQLPDRKKLKEFSTCMKAKLKLLIAMSHGARFLILDEPTAGLDVLVREEILDLLREYMIPGDRSILISSHISADLEGFCDDLYLIDHGQILLHEETDVLLEHYGLLKLTEEQYASMDRSYILRSRKEVYGYSCLTAQRQYYEENMPGISVERGSIDDVITMMAKGEAV